jgi:ABC-type transport system involved in multi-copper enzyme maturation permease subunit
MTAPAAQAAVPETAPSAWRAWWFLVRLSFRRQLRLRDMVWVALGLLAFSSLLVAFLNLSGQLLPRRWLRFAMLTVSANALPDRWSLFGSFWLIVPPPSTPFIVYTQGIVLGLFLGFLLPMWTLSFATEALGGEREQNNLLWLLSRPLDRGAIYLAKFVALLPWTLAFNLGGFVLLCLLGGQPGRQALELFWPIVLLATLAFAALFHLLAAASRRPTILALVYVFFLEIILNLMPGYLKWATIGFYVRCMMLEAGAPHGLPQPRADLFVPVSATTALVVLIVATVVLLGLGVWIFRRAQYQDGAA